MDGMAASRVEYRYRFLIMLAIYIAAFACWPLDRHDICGVFTTLLPATSLGAGLGFLIPTAVVALAAALFTYSSTGSELSRFSRSLQYFATWLCWFAFGLLLNWIALLIVAVGMTVFILRLLGREQVRSFHTLPLTRSWSRALRNGLSLWIASAALLTLSLTLKEWLFFLVLTLAFLARLLFRNASDAEA